MDPVKGLDGFGSKINKREKSTTASDSDPAQVSDANKTTGVNISGGGNLEAVSSCLPVIPCMVREQDQYMPIANVIRIMRRILPPHAKISDDAKETIQECVSEYISFITGEANERCQREQRKTVTAEDVLWAMGKLGFDNYIEPLTVFLAKYREAEGTDRSSLQFAKRERGDNQYAVVPGHYAPQGFALAAHYQHGMYDAAAMSSGYYRDGGSGGAGAVSPSSSQGQGQSVVGGVFDPYAQFK